MAAPVSEEKRERSVGGEGSVRFGPLKHQRRGRVKGDGRLGDGDGNVAVRGSDGKAGKNGGDHRRDEPDGTIRAPLVRAYVEGPAHGSPGTVGTTSAGGAGPADAGSVMRPSKMSCAK